MAKKTLTPTPMLRREIRDAILNGVADPDIRSAMIDKYGRKIAYTTIDATIREQHVWQDGVDAMTRLPKRGVVDLPAHLGCNDPNGRVRMRLEISFYDSDQERWVRFGHTVDDSGKGRLQDIINRSIGKVASEAQGKGYRPAHITSSMTSGRTSYRITHVECV